MSKNIDDIVKEVMKNNKELHTMDNHLTKDISELKRSVKNIEAKIQRMDGIIQKVYDTLEAITIALHDAEIEEAMMEDLEEQEESEDWTPYEDRNFTFDDDEEDDL
jgi:DNA anti-recombination protein RmuC